SCADCVAFAENAACFANLNNVRTILDHISHSCSSLLGPVSDAFFKIVIKQARLERVFVTMASGDTDRMSCSLHSRARYPAFIDRLSQRHVVKALSSDISDRCEASHQEVIGITRTKNRAERFVILDRGRAAGRITQYASNNVSMRVNESGQQRGVAEVYHLSA